MVELRKERRRRADANANAPLAREDAVLFVDDEPALGRVFRRTLGEVDYRITAVTSPDAAMTAARAHAFKVVVTDLRMPGMDGLTLIERLRGIQPDLVFLIVTGLPEMDLRRSADTDASILATLAKPWDGQELREMVQRGVELYDRRQLRRSSLPPGRISALVVEDEPADAARVQRYLERRCDAVVEVAARVSEAEVMLGQQAPDLVVADLSLPDARGLDAVRRIRRAAPQSAIVVMSGIDDESLARQALRLGAQDFLVKGQFDPKRLRHAVTFAMEREQHVNSLVSLAHYDPLTGLANRRTLQDRYVFARSLARDRGTKLGFLSLDLDRFKTINDTLGHEAGDALLQTVARRVERCVREHDTVARLGGDEFAVLLTEIDGPKSAAAVARRVLRALREPIEIDGTSVVVTSSVGALVPDDDATLDDVLRAADKTMYEAKRCGRNQLVQAGVAHAAQSHDRLVLEQEITAAVRERRFALHYQPQFRADDGALAGFEALMRWTRVDGTRVSPAVFIPLLEELGLVSELGPWLFEESCAELKRFEAASGRSDVRMAVNLSGQQFERPGLVASVAKALSESGVDPDNFELEITEGLLMRDTDQTREILEAFHDLGVRVAIDDFGTGYSSLAYLQRFDVSTLKIDRCFIQRMGDDRGGCIAEAVISLGHRLGMEIVAEGVETPEQLDMLRAEGCELVQGFFLARPGPSTLDHVEADALAS